MNARLLVILTLVALTTTSINGCVTERTDSSRNRLFGTNQLDDVERQRDVEPVDPAAVVDRDSDPTSSQARMLSEFIPLGEVRFDQLTFPLVSPDGRFIVSETGIDPTLASVMASRDATVPVATTITVYEILPGESATEDTDAIKPRIVQRYVLDDSLVLGRSCNANGFLVEAPRPDNSRWLGFVSWESGEVTWIVQDEYVNAHGALGPEGRLAWARRLPFDENFELRVMIGGTVMTFGQQTSSWVYPTWTRSGDGLFCVRILDDDQMTAVFLRGDTRDAMLQSIREIILSKQGSLRVAYAMMAPNPAVSGLPLRTQPTLVFYHPEFNGVAIWKPLAQGPEATRMMDEGSAAGVLDEQGYIVFASPGGLVGQPLGNAKARQRIMRGMPLPRLTDSRRWKYILFVPSASSPDTLSVVGMNLRIDK